MTIFATEICGEIYARYKTLSTLRSQKKKLMLGETIIVAKAVDLNVTQQFTLCHQGESNLDMSSNTLFITQDNIFPSPAALILPFHTC